MTIDGDPTDLDDGGPNGLREAALTGVRWFAFGTVITELGTLVASIVLAHLISPAEFGAVAPSIFVLSVGIGLAAASFGSPLVRAEKLTTSLVQTAFALSLISGVAVTGTIILATELFTFGLSDHALELVRVVSPSFALYSLGAVSQALLERDLAFQRVAVNQVGAIVPGTITTVVLALLGLNGLAIVLGFLVTATFMSVQALWWRPPPPPSIHRSDIHQILSFGLPVSLSSILYTMQRTIGFWILGARLTATQAGYFLRASQLGLEYQAKVSNILVRLLFPLLARSDSPDQVRRVRSRMVKVHTAILFLPLALLIVLAPDLVPWLYGQRWEGAVEPTQILAIAGFAVVVNTGTGPLVMAAGHPKALLIKDCIELPLLVVVLILTSAHGLIAACIGLAAFRVVSLITNQYFLADRLCGIPISETLIRDVLPAASSAVAAAVSAYAVQGLVGDAVPVLVSMLASSAVGVAAYCLVLRTAFSPLWVDVTTVMMRLRTERQAA